MQARNRNCCMYTRSQEISLTWQERLANLSQNVPGVLYQYQMLPDGSHSIPYVSERVIDIFGVTPQEAMSNADTVFNRIVPQDVDAVVASLQESARSSEPWSREFRVVLPNGKVRWVQAEATSQQLPHGGSLWSGLARDVTERKTLELALRDAQEELVRLVEDRTGKLLNTISELSRVNKEVQEEISERIKLEKRLKESHELLSLLAADLILSEERERRRIANELHDDVVQYLALGKLKLDMTPDPAAPPPDLLEALVNLIVNAMQQIRRICNDLSPPLLYDLGLAQAIESMGERLAREHDLQFTIKATLPEGPLSDHLRTALYLTARELLTNAVKHAKAKNVAVRLRKKLGTVQLAVMDDGVGFAPPIQKGFGLSHTQQRIEFLKGKLSITSAPGRKTTISVLVPLE